MDTFLDMFIDILSRPQGILLIVIIILALGFDFINGFHDAANSIATIVVTKVLTPLQAVIWAAFFILLHILSPYMS